MLNITILSFYYFMWYLLVVTAVFYVISGLDDLFIDIVYWSRYCYRKIKFKSYSAFAYEKLSAPLQKKIAVLVPVWHEANIIGNMLRHNVLAIDYENYDIFVGVYPNDPDTIRDVQDVAKEYLNIHCVIGPQDGPTDKASNLNAMYQYVKKYEEENNNTKFDIIVFHDAEDIIHPLSFKLYNYLIPHKDMVQLPVLPLEVKWYQFTSWSYADEFSETHTKDLVVREALKGLVPSAGVGTGFARSAIELLARDNNGVPFSTMTLTEDYGTALKLRNLNLKQIFVIQYVQKTRFKHRWIWWGKYVPRQVKEIVATRELFPTEYRKAVRQKARWILGITIQEWWYTGWQGSLWTRYTLLHDRKGAFANIINFFGYLLFIFWAVYYIFVYFNPEYPSLNERIVANRWIWYLLLVILFMMCERICQRAFAMYRIYNLAQALLSIPRTIYTNLINMHALFRAYRTFIYNVNKKGKKIAWEKTDHGFPGSHILIPYKKRLGDLLIERKKITKEQLFTLLDEHHSTGIQLGELLRKHHFINNKEFAELLAEQFNLPLLLPTDIHPMAAEKLAKIPNKLSAFLKKHNCEIVDVTTNDEWVIALSDPSNENLIREIFEHTKPHAVKFVMVMVRDNVVDLRQQGVFPLPLNHPMYDNDPFI